MSDPSTPGAADFPLTRKGYDVDQVDQSLAQLTDARDQAWQRLSGLGDEMRALERRLMDVQAAQVVAEAAVPDFETLSPRAAGLLVTAEEEAETVRSDAVAESTRIEGEARTEARRRRTVAAQYADQMRAAADESHRRELDRARNQAEALRGEADRDARGVLDAATGHAEEVRVRADQASREAHSWLSGQQRTVEQEFAAHEAKVVAWEDEVIAIGERKVSESERHLKAMQAKSDEIDADASTQSERLVEAARREAVRIAEQSDRELATFTQTREHIQAQLDHIRETLVALTGSAAATADPASPPDAEPATEPAPEPDPAPAPASEADTSELPTLPQPVDNNPDNR
ncbi:hypothetical protein DN069_31670 [Streptacidiphilus pinicola]|uniref:Cellulose-binding protein n=1 Tax=Streptacidiphilus pinicola TaxID=2219663 RepID=A0A2X0K2Z3_9ACTN|nr:hypothetical protein [Streptacidiphilus pinicola]RAG81680.1 hypothetical protein DN069_31670 [Streptacidiphilus pinicola]